MIIEENGIFISFSIPETESAETYEELKNYGKGTIIELSEKWNEPVLIYHQKKLRALAKVYITGGHFAVRITDVL
ncbi:MAG: FliM/FliN family flagellar motor switch protein [Treponema sp.]